jgi:hypothetical protein
MSGIQILRDETTHASYLESIQLTQDLLRDVLIDISLLTQFDREKEFYWNREIMDLTRHISTFVEITTLLAKIGLTRNNIQAPQFKDSHIQLLYVMKGMNQAQLKRDFLALEELIKYELKDILTQWKIDLLPQLKKLFNP